MPLGTPSYLIYLAVFAVAAAGCLAGAWWAYRQVSLPGVRRGLAGLLSASGLWALCHVGVLLSPGLGLKVAFYEAGLTVGFGTVFAWLWLCSAYSGRALHRRPSVRWAALAVFAAVTLTKLTNRWHGLYFSAELSAVPFRHLEVDHHVIYWLTAGLSYALAAVGFCMLAEPLRRAQVGGGKLAGLFGLTALPLGANAIGYAGPYLLDLSHEPVGVAAFALGALALKGSPSSGSRKESCLEEASRAGREERPSLVLSAGGRIQNYNRAAAEVFPALRGGTPQEGIPQEGTPKEGTPQEEEIAGRHLEEALPRLGRALNGESPGTEPSGTEPSGAEPSGAELSGKNPSGKELEGKKGPEDNEGPEENEELRENGRRSEEKFSAEKPSAEEKLLEMPAGGGEARYYRPVESQAGPGAGRLVVLQDVTERELRRRERASRLEAISDSMPGLAFEFRAGPGGKRSVEFIGEEAGSFLGLSSGLEEAFERFTEHVPEGHREEFRESVGSAVEGRSSWRHEFPFERPGGERIWLLGSAEPSAESSPEAEGVVFRGTLADITGRKRREQELRESRRELRREKRRAESITENVSEGIYRSTEEGIVYANSAFIEMFGYRDLKELREAGPEALYVDPSRREELIEKEHRHGRLRQEEVRYRRKDGTVFVALLSSQQVEGEEEGKTYFDGAITDITERRRRKEELKRKKEELERKNDLFERAQEIASVGAWEHDLRADEGNWTKKAYEILGHPLDADANPEDSLRHYHPEDQPRVREALMEAVENGKSSDLEVRVGSDGDEVRWVRIRGEPQREDGNPEGEVARLRGTIQDITERKKRERRLRQSETLFQNAQDALFLIDVESGGADRGEGRREFSIRRVNPAYEAATGFSGEDLYGRPLQDIFGEEAGQEIEERYRRCVRRQKPIEYEEELPVGGEVTYWQTRIAPVMVEGEVDQIVGTTRDVAEQREREERLQRQKSLLEQTQRLAGAWEADLKSGEVSWSEKVYEIHEMEPGAEISLKEGLGFYAPESKGRAEEATEALVEEGKPYDLELQIDTAEGHRRWVRSVGAPVEMEGAETEGGEATKIAGAFQDITGRKKEERRRKQVISRATDGILKVDSEWQITLVNEQAEALYGMAEEEMLGRSLWEVFGQLEGTRFEEVYREAMRSREPAAIEERYSGMGEWFDVQMYPSESGGLDFYFRIITDQKEREEALREAKEEAERAKEEAEEAKEEAETSRREAEEAKEEAQEASRLKSALLANMSHEIRTPLTSIIGFAEMLGREAAGLELPGDSPLPGYASTIERSGKRLLETLNGVLNLSKLQAGQMEMEAGPTCLPEQARLAAEELRPEAEEKGIGLELETGGGPAVLAEADEGGMQIVLRNLLSNAIKYTDEGGVTVRTYREDGNQKDGDQEDGHPQEDGRAVLEVEDTGIGMDPEVAEVLFEPFRQASEGISREYEGTGIGLAVTREAVDQMGGSIEVETEKGQGTCMTVRLPLAGEAGAA
ncbi:PAS domain S-box protein [Salinibacter ruber]|uniref:PAS domain S-box protein n=2 Tax=Salinibacter ruber TaxID=146919 RepID=UPI0021693C74|nr:PAS domain S-box protein [Salinibacter ruber]MCS3784718.1 PAS domain S-box-containing protein [Salinibacter ruber]